MKEKRLRAYVVPMCEVLLSESESLLNSASGNVGTIGPGISGGDAKRNVAWDEDEDDGVEILEGNALASYRTYKREND